MRKSDTQIKHLLYPVTTAESWVGKKKSNHQYKEYSPTGNKVRQYKVGTQMEVNDKTGKISIETFDVNADMKDKLGN